MKIRKILKKLRHKYSISFAVPEKQFLNKKCLETNNFYDLAKIHKPRIIEQPFFLKNIEVVLGGEPSNLKVRSIDKLENLVTFGYSSKFILKNTTFKMLTFLD